MSYHHPVTERLLPPLLAAALLVACGPPKVPMDEMRVRFAEATRDAAVAEPAEVVTDLPAVVPGNDELVWGEDGRLKVVAWPARPGRLERRGMATRLERDLWVTPAPGLEELCTRIATGEAELLLRLEQLLGMPPGSGRGRTVVELWVEPFDVFRPCPDPDPTDSLCDLHAPLGDEHRRWFSAQEAAGAMPAGRLWTRLGYTYDWGNPYSEVGLPELVVPAGTRVEVARAEPTREYCRRD